MTFTLIADLTYAFPSSLWALALASLRHYCLRGGIIDVTWQLSCRSTSGRLSVADCRYTAAVIREVGFGGGRALSPLVFVFVVDELLCKLQTAGIGTVVQTADGPSIWAGAALGADDIALLACSRTELAAMFDIVFMWVWATVAPPVPRLVRQSEAGDEWATPARVRGVAAQNQAVPA